jgi:branched-chain amino acid transport system permease protein
VQIFATIGLTVVFQNLALLLWKSDFRSIKLPQLDHTFVVLGVRLNQPKVLAFLVAAALTGALFLFLQRTFYGKAIRAVSQDRKSARLMGIDVDHIYVLTFAIGTACVGVAGGLLMAIYPVFPTVGLQFGVISFVVVVLGGLGSTTGAAVGGLLIGVIETLSGFFIDPALKQAVYFILFILVLTLRPAGLFGVRGAEEFGLK